MRHLFAVAMFAIVWQSQANACDQFSRIPPEQAIELDGMLRNPRASEMARIQAYETLACSDSQTIRTMTMQTALKQGNPDSLRGRALQDAISTKRNFVIDLGPVNNPDQATMHFLKQNNNAVTLRNLYVDAQKGCISLAGSTTSCYPGANIQLRGTKIELREDSYRLVGELQLNSEWELVGRMKHGNGVFMPARMKLF